MGTRLIIPNADFSKNGLPLEKNIVFLLGAGETARVLMGLQTSGFQPAVAPEGTVEEIVYNQDTASRYYGFNIPDNITVLKSVLSKESDSAAVNNGFKEVVFNNLSESMVQYTCSRCYVHGSVTVKNTELTSVEGDFSGFAQYSRITGIIDLSGITYKNRVTKCSGTFYGANQTKQIYIPNIPKMTYVNSMFNTCSALEYIDMSGCSMDSVVYNASLHASMFNNSNKLTTIKVEGCTDANKNFFIARLAEAGYVFYETTDEFGKTILSKDTSGWSSETYNSGTSYTTWDNTTDPEGFTAQGTYHIVVSDGTNNYYFTKTVA